MVGPQVVGLTSLGREKPLRGVRLTAPSGGEPSRTERDLDGNLLSRVNTLFRNVTVTMQGASNGART